VNETSGTRIQSVARAARLLTWLAGRTDGATVREIAASQGLSLPTAYHMINTLVDEGFLAKDAARRYILGDAAALLAQAYLRMTSVSERLSGLLKELATLTRETVYMADWGADDIRILGSLEGSQMVRVGEIDAPGPYENAHARANGKVLLAYAAPEVRDRYLDNHRFRQLTPNTITSRAALDKELASVRRRGLAYDNEEFLLGVSCIAAPLLRNGALVASFAILVPTDRFKKTRASLKDTLLTVLAEG
jgi:IclR family acetate operon transcriptional repressor